MSNQQHFPTSSAPTSPQPDGLAQSFQPAGTMALSAPGKVRSTGSAIGLSIVTLGIYGLVWLYATNDEMKRYSGRGLGGGLALVLSVLTGGLVTTFTMPSEIEGLHHARGMRSPVSAATGLWVLLPLVGGLVWLVKVNGALNSFWRSQGARG